MIFDSTREKVLLTQRTDNCKWCLPGGAMDAGESATEACEREVFEETSLKIKVKRLIGVYSNPNQLVIYKDGTKVFMVALSFEAEVLSGELNLSNETTAFGYFSLQEMESMPMHGEHKERILDALLNQKDAVIR